MRLSFFPALLASALLAAFVAGCSRQGPQTVHQTNADSPAAPAPQDIARLEAATCRRVKIQRLNGRVDRFVGQLPTHWGLDSLGLGPSECEVTEDERWGKVIRLTSGTNAMATLFVRLGSGEIEVPLQTGRRYEAEVFFTTAGLAERAVPRLAWQFSAGDVALVDPTEGASVDYLTNGLVVASRDLPRSDGWTNARLSIAVSGDRLEGMAYVSPDASSGQTATILVSKIVLRAVSDGERIVAAR